MPVRMRMSGVEKSSLALCLQELMSFNRDGTMLASASVKGTVIRVHHMPQGSLLFSFRRGTYPATIYSFAFSAPGEEPELLAAASSNGSVHLFHLKEQERSAPPRPRMCSRSHQAEGARACM